MPLAQAMKMHHTRKATIYMHLHLAPPSRLAVQGYAHAAKPQLWSHLRKAAAAAHQQDIPCPMSHKAGAHPYSMFRLMEVLYHVDDATSQLYPGLLSPLLAF